MTDDSLLRLFSARAPARGTALALCDEAGAVDHARLHARVAATAQALALRGIGPGQCVAIRAAHDAEGVVALLAVLAAGAAYVPIDPQQPETRVRAMLADASPRMALGAPGFFTPLGLPVCLPRDGDPPGELPAVAVHGDDLAYVLFTSGSTGRPKGVAMRRGALAGLLEWHLEDPRLGAAARTLQFAPLTFDVHFQEIVPTLAAGGTVVVAPREWRRDPAMLRDGLVARRVERLFLPYVALQLLADACREEMRLPLTLRDVISAGEALRLTPAIRRLFALLPFARLHNHYGPTEAHVVTAYTLPGSTDSWPAVAPIGHALPHVRVALREPDSDALAIDEGELLLGGECLAAGYLGAAASEDRRFFENGAAGPGRWYATGDRVRRDGAGLLHHLGRLDRQVKVDGVRIEPAEVENVLLEHPALRAVAVGAVERDGLRELVAWCVPRDPERFDVEALAAHARARLPAPMRPARFHALDALPTTASGKIDAAALAEPARAATRAMPPATTVIERIRRQWSTALAREVGADENPFEQDARSLHVVRLVAALAAEGLAVSAADVYAAPSSTALARRLEAPAAGAQLEPRGRAQREALKRLARTPGVRP